VGLLIIALSAPSFCEEDDFDDADIVDEDMADEPVMEDLKVPMREKPVYKTPQVKGDAFFVETFDDATAIGKTWKLSTARKDDTDDNIAKYDGHWVIEEPEESSLQGDKGLVLKSRAKHHAISAFLKKPFTFEGKPFVVQYEVKFQNGQECGGAYVKLLSQKSNQKLEEFFDKTPYTIMFGPDKCGNDNKLHFIFRHMSPVSGTFEEKHAKKPTADISGFFTDKKSHLFTLVINPDQTFEVFVDQDMVNSGSLLEDMTPAVNPPKEIVDPDDKKPADWDDREKMPDPEASKPEDWDESEPEMIPDENAVIPEGWLEDEPELIPDPDAEKPADWDEDMDGEWEAPMISNPICESAPGCGTWERPSIKNPKYMGKWRPPMIENPNYKGKWRPRMIENPEFFEDVNPYKMTPIGAIGLELWSMSDNILFDNFIITDDKSIADAFAAESWELKHVHELQAASGGWLYYLYETANERPWLYAVYLIIFLLPVVLISQILCPKRGPGFQAEEAARRKKTDEAAADDSEDEAEKKKKGEGDASSAPKKSSKGALEAEDEDENEGDVEEDDEEEDSSATKKTSPRRRKGAKRE